MATHPTGTLYCLDLCNNPSLCSQAVLDFLGGKIAASTRFCAETEKQVCFYKEQQIVFMSKL